MKIFKTKKIGFLSLFSFLIIFCGFFYSVSPVNALKSEIAWPQIPEASKQISINCVNGTCDLNPNFTLPDIVKYFFNFFIVLGGLAAFAMIVWGGVQYLTSAGNPTTTGLAKEKITSALIGLLLLLGSYLLIQVINPDLLVLSNPF
jgi:hypothetical protein